MSASCAITLLIVQNRSKLRSFRRKFTSTLPALTRILRNVTSTIAPRQNASPIDRIGCPRLTKGLRKQAKKEKKAAKKAMKEDKKVDASSVPPKVPFSS